MSLQRAVDTCAQRTSVCRVGDKSSSRNTLAHKDDVKTLNQSSSDINQTKGGMFWHLVHHDGWVRVSDAMRTTEMSYVNLFLSIWLVITVSNRTQFHAGALAGSFRYGVLLTD